jgi:peptidoglycan hydrolase-like protein with peptidoglycan-binding domain
MNDTYTGVAGWNPVGEDGQVGWQTMHALTRALQHELGITALADAVGPATMAKLEELGDIGPNTTHANMGRIITILTGTCYCKGYNAGDGYLHSTWSGAISDAIELVQSNLGILQTGTVSPKLFKSLLSLDAYIVVGSGTESVREVQQWMNSTYLSQSWFSIIPTDGSYSRDVQKALVYAIQKELNVAGANGVYGPGTRAAVAAKAPIIAGTSGTSIQRWVRLFQAALRFNGVASDFDGSFSASDSQLTESFQRFCKLPQTGKGDYQTWSSLLVSTGDPDRAGTAADCASEVTPARAAALMADGRTVVGRYLTNAQFTVNPPPLNKKIQTGELESIFAAGLRVFPIYQTSGNNISYFSASQGREDCQAAVEAATQYGFRGNTTIYFSVDCDPVGSEIDNRIVPHFQSINAWMRNLGNRYKVGVYGTRHVCSTLDKLNLAKYSFVAGMSTGWSGNLGFLLPDNWAFDQISTINIGTGSGLINIDNDIASGKDLGQSSIAVLPANGQNPDVEFDFALEQQLANEIQLYCPTVPDHPFHLFSDDMTTLASVLQHDALITALARTWGIRKAFIQAVAFWERWNTQPDDIVVDVLVHSTYMYLEQYEAYEDNGMFGTPPEPPILMREDSSTGFAQIFAATGIAAHNWTVTSGYSAENLLDSEDWHNMWYMWNNLHSSEEFSLSMVPKVLLWGAESVGVAGGPRLSYTSAEINTIISRYNGTGPAAQQYGVNVRGFYNIFETYNAISRS